MDIVGTLREAVKTLTHQSITGSKLVNWLEQFEEFLEHEREHLKGMSEDKKEIEAQKQKSLNRRSSAPVSQQTLLQPPVTASHPLKGFSGRFFRRTKQNQPAWSPSDWKIIYSRQQRQRRKERFKDLVGRDFTVYAIITLGFIASIIVQAYAILQYKYDARNSNSSPPSSGANIDSSFYCTLSQTVTAIMSIFTIIIPSVRQDEREPLLLQWKPFWYFLLTLSFVSSIAAAVVYPWQGVASIMIAYVSTAAQLAATLQVILGQSMKLQQQAERVYELKGAVADLEFELGNR